MLIHITGASGSGTSTLGRALAAELGMPYLDGDDYYWVDPKPPFTEKRAPAERTRLLLADLRSHQDAILAGSILGWGAELENAFDLIVFLYLDTAVRVERLRAREIERFGAADAKFLDWAAQYDGQPSEGRSLAKHRDWLSRRTCPVLPVHGDLSVADRVSVVLGQLPKSVSVLSSKL